MEETNMSSYDVVVLGAGPGGYVAAVRAAQLGRKTACVEARHLGGICLNWGCIPTKSLLKAAEAWETVKKAAEYGITLENPAFDFARIVQRSRLAAERMSKGVAFLFKKNGVEHIAGTGRILETPEGRPVVVGVFDDKGTLTRSLSAENLIIATGARPRVLPGAPFDGKRVLSPYDALALASLPSSMVIIGGGAIGVEFAFFYSAFGTRVTILEMLGHLLPIEDEEISAELERSFRKRKITVKTGTRVEGVEPDGTGVRVRVSGRNGEETLEADVALTAIGVRGNIEGIGLEGTPIRTRDGFIPVDRAYRTDHPRVYAVGDVIGPPWLAHVASAEAVACVETMTGHREAVVDYENIPGCTYCTPQVASVGLTEKQAREKGFEVRIGKFPFTASGKAVAAGHTEGFVKLVFDAASDRLLGAHIIGDGATELIAEAALARSLGATAGDIARTVHAHPTLSEALMEAAASAHGESVNI